MRGNLGGYVFNVMILWACSLVRPAVCTDQPVGIITAPFKRQLDAIQFSADANRSISAEHPDGVIPAASIVKVSSYDSVPHCGFLTDD